MTPSQGWSTHLPTPKTTIFCTEVRARGWHRERLGLSAILIPGIYWAALTLTPISKDRGDLLPSAFPLDQRADGVWTGKKDQDERDLGRHRLLVT